MGKNNITPEIKVSYASQFFQMHLHVKSTISYKSDTCFKKLFVLILFVLDTCNVKYMIIVDQVLKAKKCTFATCHSLIQYRIRNEVFAVIHTFIFFTCVPLGDI